MNVIRDGEIVKARRGAVKQFEGETWRPRRNAAKIYSALP